ncbi:hypothetical protein FPV67DRAFT_587906 [Lyophyllum atratum]|nr:hypothetical protein FPV67DRAFT_587906 [Lyophyllum atratum]
MHPASTFRGGGGRPDSIHRLASSSSSVHREDEQPNEAINQRQRARPPSVVSASLPPSGRGHWARDQSESDSQAFQRPRSGWNQHAVRGNKGWRGARGGRGGRHVGHESHRASSYHGRHPSTTREQTSDAFSPSWNKRQDHHHPTSPTNFTRPVTYPTLGHSPHEPHYPTHRVPMTSPPLVPLQPSEVKNGTMLLPSSSEKSCTITTSTLQTQSYETNQSTHHTHFAPHPSSATQTQSKPNNGELAVPITRSIARSTISRDATPPLKRRRLSHSPSPLIKAEEAEDPIIPTPSNQHSTSPELHPTIKSELRSPSPPSRRLITQSCTLYALPDNCRKMNPYPNPEYAKNRTVLMTKERDVLKRRGFKVTSVLFRYFYRITPFRITSSLV